MTMFCESRHGHQSRRLGGQFWLPQKAQQLGSSAMGPKKTMRILDHIDIACAEVEWMDCRSLAMQSVKSSRCGYEESFNVAQVACRNQQVEQVVEVHCTVEIQVSCEELHAPQELFVDRQVAIREGPQCD